MIGEVTGVSFEKRTVANDVEVSKVYRGVSIIYTYNVR